MLAFVLFITSSQGGDKFKCKNFLYPLSKVRGVYTPLVIHIHDTATDIGVLYEWYKLAQREKKGEEYDIETLDMEQLFLIGMWLMIAYRNSTNCKIKM